MQTRKNKGISRPTGEIQKVLRKLPSVESILSGEGFEIATERLGRGFAVSILREILETIRTEVRDGRIDPARESLESLWTVEALTEKVLARGEEILRPSPVPVVNATGVVVHTNLGRSILSAAAARRVAEAACGYMNLEYDLDTGRRGSRLSHFDRLMERLFPGYGFLLVNNNAAGILIALRALAREKEVVISRGELVEIGGSFRVPDIFVASGAFLREVGTTNRTRISDFLEATGDRTAAWLKVHTSNFRIIGFTEEPTLEEMASGAGERGIPLIVDWGSGDLADLAPLGFGDEIPVRTILERGADLVTFSGDKLLGGPQAGFVVGKKELVERLRKDPMARVCRLDRLKICALQETLAAYVRGDAFETIPTLRMLKEDAGAIGARAQAVLEQVAEATGRSDRLGTRAGESRSGGGSSPGGVRPTVLLVVEGKDGDEGRLESVLRTGSPPVIGRIRAGCLLLDLRTVLPEQDSILADRLIQALSEAP